MDRCPSESLSCRQIQAAFLQLGGHEFGSRHLFQLSHAGYVIPVTVGGGENSHIAHRESELLDALLDRLRGVANTAVDEDVSLRRRDQIGREVVASDPVDVPDDFERWEGLGPLWIVLDSAFSRKTRNEGAREDSDEARE